MVLPSTDELPRRGLLTDVADVGPVMLAGRAVVWILFTWWAYDFAMHSVRSAYAMQSFLHGVHLVFHEAGHLIFAVFGDLMRVFGGSLMQVLVPSVFVGAFVWRRNPFGAAICLWWAGQSLVDLAPYIDDAYWLELPLLGGITGADSPEYHDWQNLLSRFALLPKAGLIGKWTHGAGLGLMFAGLGWAAEVLRRQWNRREEGIPPFLR